MGKAVGTVLIAKDTAGELRRFVSTCMDIWILAVIKQGAVSDKKRKSEENL